MHGLAVELNVFVPGIGGVLNAYEQVAAIVSVFRVEVNGASVFWFNSKMIFSKSSFNPERAFCFSEIFLITLSSSSFFD